MHLEEPYPSRMLAAGAAGYISKDSAAEEVVAAIRRVHGGGHYVAADVAGNLAASLVKGPNGASPFDQLSQRETQVMLMVTKGYSTQEVSDRLHLSPKTVSTYRYRLDRKGVVWGKGGSVRVDLGGPRYIIKNKYTENTVELMNRAES